MAVFGRKSTKELNTLHPDLQMVFNIAIRYVDFSIVEGHREEELQLKYFNEGKTKVLFPFSKHNSFPSLAADIVPWVPGKGQDWNDRDRYYKVLFFIKGIAYANGIILRIGADWDGDFYSNDHKFLDLPHIELYKKLINGKWVKYENQI